MNSFRLVVGASLLVLTLGFAGCGTTGSNSSTTPPPPPTANNANLSIFATDAPADNVLAFKMDVTSISVTDAAGTNTTLSTTPQTLELRHLQLAPTLALQAANLPRGQYNSINLTVANPELAGPRRGDFDILELQLLGATIFADDEGAAHGLLPRCGLGLGLRPRSRRGFRSRLGGRA